MNLGDFRRRVSKVLGVENTVSGDQVEIDEAINEGVLDMLRKANVVVQKGTATLTAGTADYTLDSDILRMIDVYVTASSRNYALEQLPVPQLLHYRHTNTDLTDTVRYYALAGSNTLMVYPTPNAADVVTIYYVPRPTALSDASHDPSEATYGGIPKEFNRGIELYALWRCADMNDDKSSEQGERYRALYEAFIRECNRDVSRKGGSILPRAATSRYRKIIPGRNDIYP